MNCIQSARFTSGTFWKPFICIKHVYSGSSECLRFCSNMHHLCSKRTLQLPNFFSSLCSFLLKLCVIQLLRYKERLETKYIKPRKLRGNSETLVGSAWTFLEKGSDDFRDGLPPEANYDYVKKVRVTWIAGLIKLICQYKWTISIYCSSFATIVTWAVLFQKITPVSPHVRFFILTTPLWTFHICIIEGAVNAFLIWKHSNVNIYNFACILCCAQLYIM